MKVGLKEVSLFIEEFNLGNINMEHQRIVHFKHKSKETNHVIYPRLLAVWCSFLPQQTSNKKSRAARFEPADWSPVTDLSPILDVSPSLERAEQELMQRFQAYFLFQEGGIMDPTRSMLSQAQQQQLQQQHLQQGVQQASQSATKPSTGTISGMLADFSRALGLSSTSPRPSPSEDKPVPEQQLQHHQQGLQSHTTVYQHDMQLVQQQKLTQQQIQQQNQQLHKQASQQQQQMQQMQQQQNQQLQQQNQQLQQQQLQQQLIIQEQQLYQQHLQQQQAGLVTGGNMMNEHHSLFPQHLTPQQQQMYQQHMQLQHQAQHLKKIRRSLPHSSTGVTDQTSAQVQNQLQQQHMQQLRQQLQRKDPITSQAMMNSQAVSSHLVNNQELAHMMSGQSISSHLVNNQAMLSSQPMATAHLISSQGMPTHLGSSQPVMSGAGTTSIMHQQLPGGTPLGTPQSTPVGTPRGPRDTGGDSSDTLSETDSQKSLRMRRKLPAIPSDQEAAPLPSSKKRERTKTQASQERFRSFASLRQTSLDGLLPRTSNLLLARPSASETNLRKIALGVDPVPRPGSALGLLQASSVVSSSGMRTTTTSLGPSDLTSTISTSMHSSPLADIASCLPPDLRHLLGSTGTSDTFPYSKQLPNYMRSLKEQLRDEIKTSNADRRRLLSITDKEREARLRREREKFETLRDPLKRLDMQRKLTSPVMNRSRKIRGHRRQMSDPKIHPPFSPIKEDGDSETDYDRGFMGFLHPSLKPPYKAYEYECIEDMGRRAEWDPSQSYLAFSYAAAGGALRETAINSVLDDDRYLSSSRYSLRRSSDGLGGIDTRRRHDSRKHRKPRSWHPSPYGSDDDDDQLTREEKKAKIKAEIARRRQQIEENARLHEELLRLARLRESAELGFTPHPTQDLGRSGGYGTSSVLKSIDEILLSGRGGSGLHLDYRGHSPRRTEEDRSMDRIASTFRTDDYTSGVYERLSDFSPLTDFTPHAMPLLPDMPTRSRKLLEDLGSSPITESVLAIPQKGKYGSRLYAK
uniref:Uncharacterized protein n=1 Tax=Timema douglasi TaxID=61478 RepID=A0A7R8VDE0_TIMDO|nr:unnamed protein product [Timema douglasi]